MSSSSGEQPHRGFTHVFFSFVSIYVIFTGLNWSDRQEAVRFFGLSVLGLSYLLMFMAPAFLWLKDRKAKWAQWVMISAACYVSLVAVFLIPNLLYGYYVWCLSFVIVAVALGKKPEDGQVLLSSS